MKMIWGDMTAANRALNIGPDKPFVDLRGRTYMEVGTGVDNILRFFRLDFVWRLLPTPKPEERYKNFGIFGSFRLTF
jgi:hypothetical protein